MKKYFPVFLDLKGKKVLVVGAGKVAGQKVRDLLAAGAEVRVVAREISLKRQKDVKYVKRAFRSSDLAAQDLVFSATDDEALNRRVGRLCRAGGVWVNVADRPALCDFIMPSVFRRGKVTAAFSTGGASPALAKFLRQRMEKYVGPEVDGLVRILARSRQRLLGLGLEERRAYLKKLINDRTLSKLKRGKKIGII